MKVIPFPDVKLTPENFKIILSDLVDLAASAGDELPLDLRFYVLFKCSLFVQGGDSRLHEFDMSAISGVNKVRKEMENREIMNYPKEMEAGE